MFAETKEQEEAQRVARNCDGLHPSETLSFDWAPDLRQCPFAAISPEAWQYMAVWQRWKLLDVLPEPGTLSDQPAHVYQALRLCETERAEAEQRLHDKQERELERQRAAMEAEARKRGK